MKYSNILPWPSLPITPHALYINMLCDFYASVRMRSEGIRYSVGVSVCLSVILSVTGIVAQRVQFKC